MSELELEKWLQAHPRVEYVGVDKAGEICVIKYKSAPTTKKEDYK